MSNQPMNRRQLLKSLGAGASVMMLAACVPAAAPSGSTASSGDAQSAAPSSEPVTVTLWSSYSGKNGETETALVDNFNNSQGDVVIDYQFQGNYEETAQKVTAALQAQTAPAISLLSDVWWFKFYLNQTLLPLDDLLTAESVDVA
ncbi:MAG: twin-arginine translocation signal domain-containing protein, partial [Caldilineaceae bacterium]|nr:twin-arginine translocation signal domain-containing protein [Caldilineaceae bacterium]